MCKAKALTVLLIGFSALVANTDVRAQDGTATATARVTAGGTLRPDVEDQSCIDVPTTIFPSVTPNGLVVDHISHGGSLGVPFGQAACGEILGNRCIRGHWQHTRHYEGTSNPRDVFDFSFQGTTPKGVFDSLNWACLGCCDPETGAFIPPATVGSLCNPDDREVCGPQPRPAPANAIIFSGLGLVKSLTDPGSASKPELVVFRVYLEDRGEPGGFYPEGAIEPADVYCFHAWKTGITPGKKTDYSTIAPAFRTALGQANCEFLASLEGGALPIGSRPSPTVNGVTADIQDCGPLYNGNEQIQPGTGALCAQ